MEILKVTKDAKRVLDAILELAENEGEEIETLLTKIGKHVRKNEKISDSTIHYGIKELEELELIRRKEVKMHGKSRPKIMYEINKDKIVANQIQLVKKTKNKIGGTHKNTEQKKSHLLLNKLRKN